MKRWAARWLAFGSLVIGVAGGCLVLPLWGFVPALAVTVACGLVSIKATRWCVALGGREQLPASLTRRPSRRAVDIAEGMALYAAMREEADR